MHPLWICFEVAIIVLLIAECWILHVWAAEHAAIMRQIVIDLEKLTK